MGEETERATDAPAMPSHDDPPKKPHDAAPSKEKPSGDLWSLVGKVGVAIGVIVGAITIFNEFNPRGPHVIASCAVVDISKYLSRGDEQASARIRGAFTVDAIRKAMPDEAGKAAHSQQALKALYENLIRSVWFIERFQPSYTMRAIQCEIVNDGSEPAAEVALHLPSIVKRVLVNNEEVRTIDSKSQSVSLGSVPAGPTMSVEVWITTYEVLRGDENVFLSYRGGKGKVQIAKKYFGTPAALANLWELFGWVGLVWIFSILFLMFLGIKAAIKAPEKGKKIEEA